MNLTKLAILSFKLVVYWLAGCALLWLAYGISLDIKNGNATQSSALKLVMGMSLITTILTALVWLLCLKYSNLNKAPWKRALATFLWTAAILTTYLIVVLIRRNLWTKEQGLSVYDQFLPVVGKVNGFFLGEMNWLIYLLLIVPVMSILSSLLLTMKHGTSRA